jgi:hypothetical protein
VKRIFGTVKGGAEGQKEEEKKGAREVVASKEEETFVILALAPFAVSLF